MTISRNLRDNFIAAAVLLGVGICLVGIPLNIVSGEIAQKCPANMNKPSDELLDFKVSKVEFCRINRGNIMESDDVIRTAYNLRYWAQKLAHEL
jgi:hypothetical protein